VSRRKDEVLLPISAAQAKERRRWISPLAPSATGVFRAIPITVP
jgi:hypothetical protein